MQMAASVMSYSYVDVLLYDLNIIVPIHGSSEALITAFGLGFNFIFLLSFRLKACSSRSLEIFPLVSGSDGTCGSLRCLVLPN